MNDQCVILLVEDDENDIALIKRAFERGGVRNPVCVVRDGESAVEYLSGVGKYANRDEFPLPELVLLDLKMPRLDGLEVLQWIRQQRGFSSLLVVVLTSSDQVHDVDKAYALGANSFLMKPSDFQSYESTCLVLTEYWLSMNKLPQSERPAKKNDSRAGK